MIRDDLQDANFGLAIAFSAVSKLFPRKESAMHSIAWWPTVIVVAVASITDLRSRRIPNWLVLPFLVAGVIASSMLHGWHGVAQSVEGITVGATIYGLLHYMGGMGMGDVKLAAAIGAWIGPSQLFFALFVTAIVGGIMALSWAAMGGFLGDLMQGTGDIALNVRNRGLRPHPELKLTNPLTRKMPFAPAIAVGTLVSFFAM